jgi:hypothetical protein
MFLRFLSSAGATLAPPLPSMASFGMRVLLASILILILTAPSEAAAVDCPLSQA